MNRWSGSFETLFCQKERNAFRQETFAWALVNATAGHALDYDDVAIDGHPSVVLVPALLAEGERLGASGRELIAAYVAGYETWGELASRDADKHHGKGWHPSAVFGAVAAAAAGARRPDAERTAALAAARWRAG
jgi:2-methylcitrate dehydratase PrpD